MEDSQRRIPEERPPQKNAFIHQVEDAIALGYHASLN